jgi:hypothetical protein
MLVTGYTFLSQGWWSLIRPSSSHLTTASCSFVCSTVPNCPVGIPKLPKPSTRSPGLSSESEGEGSARRGFLARSESGAAPLRDRRRLGRLAQFGYRFIAMSHFRLFFRRTSTKCPSQQLFVSSIDYSVGFEEWLGWSKLHRSDNNLAALIDSIAGRNARTLGLRRRS